MKEERTDPRHAKMMPRSFPPAEYSSFKVIKSQPG